MLRTDPLDKQRNKIPAVSERVEQMDKKLTSKDIKMAVGVAKDKRYAGGNMSGAVKTMEKMKPGLSKHPRVQQVLKSTNEEQIDEISTKMLAKAAHSASDPDSDYHYGKSHDPQKFADYAKKTKDAKSAAAVQGAADAKGHYVRPGHTLGSYDKLAHRTPARVTSSGKANKQDIKTLKGSITRNEGIDFLKIWNGIKPVHEEIKTTHEDPLVVTKDEEGNIHTHANLSVANAIHGTDVKHQAIHTGKPVQGGRFTFELSKHHAGALKEDAPFDPVAHKKELDKLMGKHMAAHTETSKLISAKAPQEAINKAQERNNAVKAEIRAHKDKVPKSPAKKDGGPGDYYASKKPGEYTGD
jgi:hypothetical protein